jgi:ArsR family transcriptional regulator
MFSMIDLATFFAALADPTRLRLLHLMKDGEICVYFLQGVLKSNQPKISRHLAYLRKAGLVEPRQDGKWMHYSLKKLDKELQSILTETLAGLAKMPQSRKDLARLKEIRCCPARYGFSSPVSEEK